MDETRLGAILIDSGIVSEADLERCLAIQVLTGATRPIGQILVEQGHVDEATLQRLLDLQKSRATLQAAEVGSRDALRASLLRAARANRATEMVVSEGRPVRIRAAGEWRELTADAVSGPEVWDFVRETLGPEVLEELADRHFVRRSWHDPEFGHGAATAFRQFDGVAARLMFAPTEAQMAADPGLPPVVLEAMRTARGLVLLAGERGIGRSEALAGLVRAAGGDPAHYVVVLDDEPPTAPAPNALVAWRRFGIGPADRAAAVRSAVREDPDVLVIADAGAPEIFELALRAAEGGRLVVAWIDAPNVVAAVRRILDFYPVYDVPRVRAALAGVLRAVVVRHHLPEADRNGIVVATELLAVEEGAREALRRGEPGDLGLLLRMEGGKCGHSLDRNMLELLAAGAVRIEDVFARAEEKAWVLERSRELQAAKR